MARKLAFESLFVAIFIDSFSYALILPTLPFLALHYGAGAGFGGILVASHALAAAVAAPILGWLSDRFGKRVVICWTIAGSVFSYIVFATSRSLGTVLVTRILAGAMAGNMGVVQAAAAAQATAEQQARAVRLLTVAWAMGFIVGPAVTSLIPGTGGHFAG